MNIWHTACDEVFSSRSTECTRLMIFLSSPEGTIDEDEVNAWIPSPAELAKMERDDVTTRLLGLRTYTTMRSTFPSTPSARGRI
jgi:hypothetical protein